MKIVKKHISNQITFVRLHIVKKILKTIQIPYFIF